ncbi:hypothetical protein Y1Q_0006335 [Alligator mississippiensis]|uniref:Uncharacterized protein n=1 Tax=Alligator mississippiensis TaxID=8496 RepID=A0A151NXG2_ALLMI|nr:hypothetical protein Y1Q_0006335 [Alligator mississippiensis]
MWRGWRCGGSFLWSRGRGRGQGWAGAAVHPGTGAGWNRITLGSAEENPQMEVDPGFFKGGGGAAASSAGVAVSLHPASFPLPLPPTRTSRPCHGSSSQGLFKAPKAGPIIPPTSKNAVLNACLICHLGPKAVVFVLLICSCISENRISILKERGARVIQINKLSSENQCRQACKNLSVSGHHSCNWSMFYQNHCVLLYCRHLGVCQNARAQDIKDFLGEFILKKRSLEPNQTTDAEQMAVTNITNHDSKGERNTPAPSALEMTTRGTRTSPTVVAATSATTTTARATTITAPLTPMTANTTIASIETTNKAYESYKKKDYTQVDYLINGMYADSEM